MVRVCSTMLALLVACLVAVNSASAQDKPKHQHTSPDQRFDALEKAVNHEPLKGELTKDEFITAMKASKSKMADKAEEFFGKIKKADETKVTKAEYVDAMKAPFQNRGKKKQ